MCNVVILNFSGDYVYFYVRGNGSLLETRKIQRLWERECKMCKITGTRIE